MRRAEGGTSFTEVLVVLVVVGVSASAVAPDWVAWRLRQRVRGVAWTLEAEFGAMRARAARDGRARAFAFQPGPAALEWVVLRDGDGDGVRSEDVAAGRDTVESGPWRLAELAPGVTPGAPAGAREGPGGSSIPADGVAVPSDILSVGPDGAGSSGTIYVSSGSGETVAIRWYGPTGRVTVWVRTEPASRWEPLGAGR